jgi:hypothetical protein
MDTRFGSVGKYVEDCRLKSRLDAILAVYLNPF